MKIGIIGPGRVGLAVARYALAAGNEVLLSGRGEPGGLADKIAALGVGASAVSVATAATAEITLLAVPWTSMESVLTSLPNWQGRILIDATNPYKVIRPERIAADIGGRISSEIVAELAPGARVVKAFNSVKMDRFNQGPLVGEARRVLFISGNDPQAKTTVRSLIESFGFAVIDLGVLSIGGRIQQSGGPLAGPDLLMPTTPT
jgi:8-hydroxy-5-deazaflavin:NADPH oxidoreductase